MNLKYRPGDLVIIKDHINFMGTNPLRNTFDLIGEARFSDMGSCYPKTLQKLALETAKKNRIRAHLGNYFAVTGPSYETPAEIRAFRKLGGDVVGMSLVPEAMTATQIGMQVMGLCYASNLAAGISKTALNHKEVLEMGQTAGKRLSLLIGEIVKQI